MIFFSCWATCIQIFLGKIHNIVTTTVTNSTNVEPVSYIDIIKPTGCQNNPGRVFPLDASASIPILVTYHKTISLSTSWYWYRLTKSINRYWVLLTFRLYWSLCDIYKTRANSSAVGGPIHISKLQFKELSKRLISVEIVIEEEAQWL